MESESSKFKKSRESQKPMSFEEAYLEALAAYLTGEWDPEKYKQYLGKSYGSLEEAKYRVPGKDITILADGEVEYEGKKRPRGDIWPSVKSLANDLDRLNRMIDAVRTAGGNVPDKVQRHFDKMKEKHEQTETAFERGKTWEVSLNRTEFREFFSAPYAPSSISIKLILKDGGDRLKTDDWRVEVWHWQDSVLRGGVKSVTETDEGLKLEIDSSAGDETGGITYDGEVVVDVAGNIKEATMSADHSGPDGGYEALYKM